mgnify:CR=1 FL=1
MLGFMCCVCMLALWLRSIPITFFGLVIWSTFSFPLGIYIGPWTIFELISWGLAPVYRPVCGLDGAPIVGEMVNLQVVVVVVVVVGVVVVLVVMFFLLLLFLFLLSNANYLTELDLQVFPLISPFDTMLCLLVGPNSLGCRAFHDSRSWMDWCTDRWAAEPEGTIK